MGFEAVSGRLWLRRAVTRVRTLEGWTAFLESDAEAAYTYHRAVLAAEGAFSDADAARIYDALTQALGRFHEYRRAALRGPRELW